MKRNLILCGATVALSLVSAAASDEPGFAVMLGGSAYSARWVAGDGGFSGTSVYDGKFDINGRDWYVEYVMRLDRNGGAENAAVAIGKLADGLSTRFLRGPLQIYYAVDGTRYVYNSKVANERLRWPANESHHVLWTGRSGICRLYVDGQLISENGWRASQPPYSLSAANVSWETRHEIRLLRMGYLADGENADGADPESLVARHFNGGNPLAFRSPSRKGLLVNIHERDMSLAGCTNEVTGAVLNPVAKTAGSLVLRTDDPYAAMLFGVGAPLTVPRYVGQYYRDTASGRLYRATGNETASDWRGYVYPADLAAFDIAKVNGLSLVGSGDLSVTAGAADERRDVTHYGALGDGVTDDSAAIAEALRAARETGRALYFPQTAAGGRYRVTKPIALNGNLVAFGERGVAICGGGTLLDVTGENVHVRDLSFETTGATAVEIHTAKAVRLERVFVRGGTMAGLAVGSSENVLLADCGASDGVCGIRLAASEAVTVRNAAVSACAVGLALAGGTKGVVFEDSLFVGCPTAVTATADDSGAVFAKNALDGCTVAGLSVAGRRFAILGNSFVNFGKDAKAVTGPLAWSVVSRNVLSAPIDDTGFNSVTSKGNVQSDGQ